MSDREEPVRVWGVPRGGNYVAAMLTGVTTFTVTSDPNDAHIAVDDIIDSGRTARRIYDSYGLDTVALIDKRDDAPPAFSYPSKSWVVFPWETTFETDAESLVVRQLEMIGENPNRKGLLDTPKRVVQSWAELYSGYQYDDSVIYDLLLKQFDIEVPQTPDQPINISDIAFYSMCEHHMLPFRGTANISYIPKDGLVIGLSKIPRMVDIYARRLQIQERLTQQIYNAVDYASNGARVELVSKHLCVGSRGHSDDGIKMRTVAQSSHWR